MKKNRFIKVTLLIFMVTIFSLIVTSGPKKTEQNNNKILKVGINKTIRTTIANTNKERSQGYSNHQPISFNEGMLFTFPQTGLYAFWMKDMLFDLDFIFIRDNKIVGLIHEVKAPIHTNGYIEYINPPTEFNKVLEVKSGYIKKYHVKIGDQIQ